jgi:hypothetical protein
MIRRALLLAAIAALFGAGCGVTTRVRPVPEGAWAVEAATGGPIAVLDGTPLPIPLATAGAAYGFAEGWDVHAHLHLTPMALGVFGADLGASHLVLDQAGPLPAVNVTGRLYAFTDLRTGLLPYAEVTGAASWHWGERWTTYGALSILYQGLGHRLYVAPTAGQQVDLGRWALQLEARWWAPHYDARQALVPWAGPGFGAFGVTLGGAYRFGGE